MPKAKNLKYCRKRAGMTQQELADALGVTLTTVRSWENKKTAMPVPATKRVAQYFNRSFSEFCDSDLEHIDLGLSDAGIKLTAQEIKNLLKFRDLPDEVKNIVRDIVNVAHEFQEKEKDK